ncbi:MAG: DoxX family protein [Ignavibacteriota bacterium]
MKLFNTIENWLDTNIDAAYTLIRIFLGTALFVRGIILSSDPGAITNLAGTNQLYWWYSYIIVIHIIGGFSLAIGFFTRLAALGQIPVLFGAVFFIHLKQGLVNVEQSLELSTLVLFLLVVYFFFGSGIFAIDNYFKKKKLLN